MAHFVELWEFECERGAITTIPFFFADVFWARVTDFAKKERLIVVYRNIFTANYHSDCERRMNVLN